jgi:hypothetical protein
VRKFSATVAYPFESLDRATSALRGALRGKMRPHDRPDWSTLEVTGPDKRVDAPGKDMVRIPRQCRVPEGRLATTPPSAR